MTEEQEDAVGKGAQDAREELEKLLEKLGQRNMRVGGFALMVFNEGGDVVMTYRHPQTAVLVGQLFGMAARISLGIGGEPPPPPAVLLPPGAN